MNIYHQVHPADFKAYDTQTIRERFLMEKLLLAGEIHMQYSHYDRMVTGGAMPVDTPIDLPGYEALKSQYFLERREMGIVSIADECSVTADGDTYVMPALSCLYLGKGVQKVTFHPAKNGQAKFILFSVPAHATHPSTLMLPHAASPAKMGSAETANERTINKYIHPDGIKSCQLMLGITRFEQGSIWNTMPPHLHDRRMETYVYFNLPEGQKVLHLMGEPSETRHILVENEQGILSPSWSIHSGVGTASYSFIWAMAGENQSFTDMDSVPLKTLY